MGVYVSARTTYHALTADKPVPPGSKSEHERPPDWTAMARAKAWRKEHDAEWMRALTSPRHFAHFLGFGHVMGELPPDEMSTAKPLRHDPYERKKQYHAFLETFRRDVKRARERGEAPRTLPLAD